MRILEINKFHFSKGGADKHFLDLVEILKMAGHQVYIFSMHHMKNKKSACERCFVSEVGYTEEYTNWEKFWGIFRMFYSFEANKKINKILDGVDPDVVHIHNVYHQIPPTILFQIKKRGIPIVMTVHDFKIVSPNYNLFHNGKFYERDKDGKFYRCILDKCIKNSYLKSFLGVLESYWHRYLGSYEKNIDLYIAPSEFTKKILVERGIDEEKITVLPHFIEANDILEEKINLNEKYALCFGRISRNKGVENLINIFKDMPEMNLYLAGDIEDVDIKWNYENIKYLGHLNSLMLKTYIKGAEFIISGSRLPETFGLVALEAISQGKPFIGFKSGGYQEIIKNGENGFLIETEEEMKKVIESFDSVHFDKNKIRRDSELKYGKEEYLKYLMQIFHRAQKIKK